jgi:hypothetical protein
MFSTERLSAQVIEVATIHLGINFAQEKMV